MSSVTLFRWSGLSLLVGGLLLALFFLFHPTGGDPPTAQEASGSLYGLEHTLGVAALLLTLVGLLGIYARLVAKHPWLALLGCLLTFLGSTLLLGTFLSEVSLVPSVAAQAPKLLASGEALSSGLRVTMILAGVLDGLGFLLLGIAVLLLGGRAVGGRCPDHRGGPLGVADGLGHHRPWCGGAGAWTELGGIYHLVGSGGSADTTLAKEGAGAVRVGRSKPEPGGGQGA